MSKAKLLSAALLAAATLATPAMAREHHVAHRYAVQDAYAATAPDAYNIYRPACVPAPRVGAFASEPWTNGNVPCEPGTGY
jgi:hypothetical protein